MSSTVKPVWSVCRRENRDRHVSCAAGARGACLLVAALALVVGLSVISPALGQTPPSYPPDFGVTVGVAVGSLSDLGKVAPELKAVGVNTVVASGPLGAAMISGAWEAQKIGMSVLLDGTALLDPAGDDAEERERALQAQGCALWTRRPLGVIRGFLFPPQLGTGLTPEQYASRLLATRSGNPLVGCLQGEPLVAPDSAVYRPPGGTEVAIYLTPADIMSLNPGVLTQRVRHVATARRLESAFPVVVFLGDGPGAEALTEAGLEAAVSAAEAARAGGFLFLRPANEDVRQMQLRVVAKLTPRLRGLLANAQALPVPRETVLASEAASPLLWQMKRYGEVTTSGLEPYVTPDGTAGYNVTGRALLNLPIPNRSAWVDAKGLTRFSMRMFSAVEGHGALLALSTAGEVSYVRIPIEAGWKLYTLDLSQATWESDKAAGLKWGGSTGIVQALTFTPVPAPGAQIAFDWIRLEPASAGEIVWELDKAEEAGKIEGLEEVAVADGAIRGRATAETVSLELALPGGRLDVKRLPFLSFGGSFPAAGLAQVEYQSPPAGGTASVRLRPGLAAQCVDLSRLGFVGGAVAGAERWGGPEQAVTRLRLTLPAERGQAWSLDWVRLGPNYDLRAVPAELQWQEDPEAPAPEPPALDQP